MASRVRLYPGAMKSTVDEALVPLIDRCLDAGVESAQRLVPIDTGELHDGIRVIEPASPEGGSYGVTDVDHAEPVEFGTDKMQAQPYLRPSIDAMKQALR